MHEPTAISSSPPRPSTRGDEFAVARGWLARLRAAGHEAEEHALDVTRLAILIGSTLGLERARLRSLALGALLHDVGKLTLPQPLLAKVGPLDADEWILMRSHPAAGEQLVARDVSERVVLDVVRSHHERWDGGGYPDGLRGEHIPLLARIAAVADAFCAMLEPRPYREPRSVADAHREIEVHAGSQFDPRCVEALRDTAEGIPV